ncbi:hypothetical protein [Flagellimonas beolgyonensis]|uniref:hypothetical protein n=1 Tax=Flagellimonas beolgyonensis TaxID=864064 RepID=UPI003D64C3F7
MEDNQMTLEESIIDMESFKEKATYKLEAVFKKWKDQKLKYCEDVDDIHLSKHIKYMSAIGHRTMKIYTDYLLPFTPVDYSLRADEINRGISKTNRELESWRKQKLITGEELDAHYNFLLENFYQVFEDAGIDLSKTLMHQSLQNLKVEKPITSEVSNKKEVTSGLWNDIEEAFGFMKRTDPRKHRDILRDDEYEKLTRWIYDYFSKGFEIPEITEPIIKVHTSKGNIIWAFKSLFSRLHPSHTLPESLFELYTTAFHQFREDRFDNFKKQRKPQYFDSL